jgi:hypothetical protein
MDQFLGRYGRAPVKREIGGGIRLVLEAMNAMQVVATPELCAMAERELAQAESPKAKAALQQLLQSLERKPARRVQDGKTSASLPGR